MSGRLSLVLSLYLLVFAVPAEAGQSTIQDDPIMSELLGATAGLKDGSIFGIPGEEVWDVDTELNTGETTSDLVPFHPGFIGSYVTLAHDRDPIFPDAAMVPDILFDFVDCDVTRPETAAVDIICIPEPAMVVLLAVGGLLLLRTRPRTAA